MRNAIQMLKKDHQKLKALFSRYARSAEADYGAKKDLSELVIREIELHTALEEETFYPAASRTLDRDGKYLVSEAAREHALIKRLITDIRATDPKGPNFDVRMRLLIQNAEQHIEEEEEDLFPRVERQLAGELEGLSVQIVERLGHMHA